MKDYADVMAKKCNTSIDTYLGSGNFGEAYLTNNNNTVTYDIAFKGLIYMSD